MSQHDTHHTAVARMISSEFLKALMIGSAKRKLARIAPEKMEHMHETQQAKGCLLEKGRLPVDHLGHRGTSGHISQKGE